jgi:putative membrane protein
VSRDRGRLVRAALLLGFAALIGKLFAAGEMVKYMTPALDPLTALTGVVLAVMGAMELRGGGDAGEADGRHPGGALDRALTYGLVLVPLALGLLVTPRALGSGALGGESVAGLLLIFAPGAAAPGAAPPPARPLADVPDLLAYLRQAGIGGVGQRVRATGMVARSDALGADELVLLRYAIAHCVADARPLALLVAGAHAPGSAPDQWVEVEGVLAAREREGDRLVTIVAERVTPVEEPRNPYLPATY